MQSNIESLKQWFSDHTPSAIKNVVGGISTVSHLTPDFFREKQYSKLIGISRCALLQIFDARVSVKDSAEKKAFIDQCNKYAPYCLEERSFGELLGLISSPDAKDNVRIVCVPKIRLHRELAPYFQQPLNTNGFFNEAGFQHEPALVVRIKRIYNLMLKFERFLQNLETDLTKEASALLKDAHPLFTDLFALDIDLSPLLQVLKDFYTDILGSVGMRPDNIGKRIEQWASPEHITQIGANCGFFIGLLLSQTNPAHRDLSGVQDIYVKLQDSMKFMSMMSINWRKKIALNIDKPGVHHVEALEALRHSTKDFLNDLDIKDGSILAQDLLNAQFIKKLRTYTDELTEHFGDLTRVSGEEDFLTLNVFSVLNLKKLYQIIGLIKLIYQSACQFKSQVNDLSVGYQNMLLLLLAHLKYDLLLSVVSYVDVLRIHLFLEGNHPDLGVSLTDTLEIYIQQLYQKIVLDIQGICPVKKYPYLAHLFDNTFNIRRLDLALKKCSYMHGEILQLETIQQYFEQFIATLPLCSPKDPEFVSAFKMSYALIEKYAPEFADDFREYLEDANKRLPHKPKNLCLVEARIKQDIAHYRVQEKMLNNFIAELAEINKSTVSFYELEPQQTYAPAVLLSDMTSLFTICKHGENYYLLDKLNNRFEKIEGSKHHDLSGICDKFFTTSSESGGNFFSKYGIFFCFKPQDCVALGLLLKQNAQFFLNGSNIFDDMLELTEPVDNDIRLASETEYLRMYNACQVQLHHPAFKTSVLRVTSHNGHTSPDDLKSKSQILKKSYTETFIARVTSTKLRPVPRRDKHVRHQQCSSFLNECMVFLRIEVPKYLSNEFAAVLQLEENKPYPIEATRFSIMQLPKKIANWMWYNSENKPYPIEATPFSIMQLPKQIANLMWLYNSLYYLHKVAAGMEDAIPLTWIQGFSTVSEIRLEAGLVHNFLKFISLVVYYRPSAQPGYDVPQMGITSQSRILCSTWRAKQSWDDLNSQLIQLLKTIHIERPENTAQLSDVEWAKVIKKHDFQNMIRSIRAVPFVFNKLRNQPINAADFHQKSLSLANQIEAVQQLSWNAMIFELPNLWRFLKEITGIIKETLLAIKELSYDDFQLIRTEMYKIYAFFDALEIDLGLKAGFLVTKVEFFLEPFTQQLLLAMRLPLPQYLDGISTQASYQYRFDALQHETNRLMRDQQKLQEDLGRLQLFLRTNPRKTDGLKDIWQIMEYYAFVQPDIPGFKKQEVDCSIQEHDIDFALYYSEYKKEWYSEVGQSSSDFKFPSNFINYLHLIQAHIQGKLNTVAVALNMHHHHSITLKHDLEQLNAFLHYSDEDKAAALDETQRIVSRHVSEMDDARDGDVRDGDVRIASIGRRVELVRDAIEKQLRSTLLALNKQQEPPYQLTLDDIDGIKENKSIQLKRIKEHCASKIKALETDCLRDFVVLMHLEGRAIEQLYSKKIKNHFSVDAIMTTLEITASADINASEVYANIERLILEQDASFRTTKIAFTGRRQILEKIEYFEDYLESLSNNATMSSWTEDSTTISEKTKFLDALKLMLIEDEFDIKDFSTKFIAMQADLTQMATSCSWMQSFIQYVVVVLEWMGWKKIRPCHSFFHDVNAIVNTSLANDNPLEPSLNAVTFGMGG